MEQTQARTIFSTTVVILLVATATIFLFEAPVHSSPAKIDYTTYIDANDLLMFVSNTGRFANDPDGLFGLESGLFYPYTDTSDITNGTNLKTAFYAAGLWLGGVDTNTGDTVLAVAEFATEFFPGPMMGGSFVAGADTVEAYRVYKLYADSAESNPNVDYTEWPDSLGAPVDGFGRPVFDGEQTLWSVFNDANPALRFQAGNTDPIGVEVHATFWADNQTLEDSHCIYAKYKLFNKGSRQLDSFYISIWLDPDLGSATDDKTGCDSLEQIFFSYNGDNDDATYGTAPPASGIKMLAGPLVPSVGDTAWFDGAMVPDSKNLTMSSFHSYVNGTDPANFRESYNIMRGLVRDGSVNANGTRYSWPGDPVAGTGDLELAMGNRHCLGSWGPISFNPGDSQFVMFKVGVGQGASNIQSIATLKTNLNGADSTVTEITDNTPDESPTDFIVYPNYPNPFNPVTTIRYDLPHATRVRIDIYNVLGQQVAKVLDAVKAAGQHHTYWDGRNDTGGPAGSGVYFYRVRTDESAVTRKMLLLK